MLRQVTQELDTNRLPATLKMTFKEVATRVKWASVIKALGDIQDLEVTTLAPKIDGRITETK